MDNLNDLSVSGVTSALQGRMSGVTVLQSSGAPGASTSVRIRGLGTFGNNEPLYVIDGMPAENMNDVNPTDIASIDVLKDASSAAIYGSRAANGVVIIQTKKGSKSDKVNIAFNMYHGISSPQKKIKMLNAAQRNTIHLEAYEAKWNDGGYSDDKPTADKPLTAAQKYYNDTRYYVDPASRPSQGLAPWAYDGVGLQENTKWLDQVMKNGAYQSNYDFSVNGGADKIRYNVMAGHLNQDGILRETNFKRTTFRVNTEIEPIKGLLIGENIMVSTSKTTNVGQMGRSGAIGSALLADPSMKVWADYDKGVFSGTEGLGADIRNPLSVVRRSDDKFHRDRIFGNVYVSYNFLEDFTIKTDFGYDKTDFLFKKFSTRTPEAGVRSNSNELSEKKFDNRRLINTTTLQYNKQVGKHKIMALAGNIYEEFREI